MITHDKLGNDEDLAREVLIVARDIAPCLGSFVEDTEDYKNALAIVRRVYLALAGRGSLFVKGQGIGSARVEYRDIVDAFAGQPTRALRALCSAAPAPGSVGSFPTERPLANLWPETYS
ncbi:hypothetical protein [Herbiconiux sp.]|uniref:hypothetical protein n=1 Tax=Herbiconiux sp. TaxID=1871186 RepID=UPI0025C43B9D|nr:hypothetical protein [Herbiconiux sp.]